MGNRKENRDHLRERNEKKEEKNHEKENKTIINAVLLEWLNMVH